MKNLLFIFADQWRRTAVGYAGCESVETPNIDKFAQESAVFTNAVSTCPLCSPARASLLTGKHPLSTGVFTNCKTGTSMRLADDEVCISDILKQEGYQTGYIGKWHLDEPESNHSEKPVSGASNWDAYTPLGPRRHGFDFWHTYNAWDNHLNPHYWGDSPQKITINKWSPIHETEVALQFLENRNQNQNFALFISWNPPHSPYDTAPQQYKDLYEHKKLERKANVELGDVMHHTYEAFPIDEETYTELQRDYYAAISGLDDQFGKLISYLKDQQLFEDTLIVLTADHGEMLGSHKLIGKHVWYEESIGIPLVIGGMGIEKKIDSTVIGSPDIAPTILELLSVPIPSTMEGTSCKEPVLEGKTILDKVCYIAACPGRDVFLKAFAQADLNPKAFGWRAIRTKNDCYVVDVGYETTPQLKRYYYDLEKDPLQLHPQEPANDHPLQTILLDWLKESKDPFMMHLNKEIQA